MLGEFAPIAQRGAVLSIYGAIYTLAGIVAPLVMGSIIDSGEPPLDGFLTGFKVLACVLIASARSAGCCCGPPGKSGAWQPSTPGLRGAPPVGPPAPAAPAVQAADDSK